MDTRNIKYFIAVYEHLHFTKAAEELNISQPTLSQQIRILEAEFGTPLFDRIGKKVVATEAGHLLRQYGEKMLQAERDAKSAVKELLSGDRGTVRLAVLPSDLDFQLVPLFVQFKSKYPNIQLQVFSTIYVQDEVLNHNVDMGIGMKGPADKKLVQIPLGSEPYHLFVNSASELAARKEITLEELVQHTIVMYPKGYLGRDLVDKVFQDEGLELHTAMETSSATSLLQLVSAGVGATIQPKELLSQFPIRPDIISIPITGPRPVRHLELIYGADRFIGSSQRQLMNWLMDFFNNRFLNP
ncbi:LysR family transcriptional regulator [Paenibacillus radicis (ex Gao et al. 2016)]|uniref:LysR family transcriptional regulator n=1 Tax=Paenibacillus radicis (ex Gao et al. 2016) TaxID=1737354 RepID=A0A917LRQ0_9BACL|nr:LysR family transcriptional regulator [Paenibacillus radicis (ex Gao et al. 2016)]GGG53131.1 LysR family transcriptional regulator [Paenibacillus radicis (ex Gao et al. 2016)]